MASLSYQSFSRRQYILDIAMLETMNLALAQSDRRVEWQARHGNHFHA